MDSQRIKFQVDQLRKDKIIYATEACAIALVSLLGYFISEEYFLSPAKDMVNVFIGLMAFGYTLYMGLGNYMRLQKIKKLEKELYK